MTWLKGAIFRYTVILIHLNKPHGLVLLPLISLFLSSFISYLFTRRLFQFLQGDERPYEHNLFRNKACPLLTRSILVFIVLNMLQWLSLFHKSCHGKTWNIDGKFQLHLLKENWVEYWSLSHDMFDSWLALHVWKATEKFNFPKPN